MTNMKTTDNKDSPCFTPQPPIPPVLLSQLQDFLNKQHEHPPEITVNINIQMNCLGKEDMSLGLANSVYFVENDIMTRRDLSLYRFQGNIRNRPTLFVTDPPRGMCGGPFHGFVDGFGSRQRYDITPDRGHDAVRARALVVG